MVPAFKSEAKVTFDFSVLRFSFSCVVFFSAKLDEQYSSLFLPKQQ